MSPIEIIVIIGAIIFVLLVIVFSIKRHKERKFTCGDECGCQAADDMKRALHQAKKDIKKE